MLFCKKPFEQIYISEAYVKTCPWTNLILGNLLETPIEVLWTNEKAEAIRESIKDGSFRFCRKEECPHCASGMLENMNESEAKAYSAELYPIDMYTTTDIETGEDKLVMLFSRKESQPLYILWKNRELK